MNNYTIIGYTEDNSYRDRCGDWVNQPGRFDKWFFHGEDSRRQFIDRLARLRFEGTFEELVILLDGLPEEEMEDGSEAAIDLAAIEAEVSDAVDRLYVVQLEATKAANLKWAAEAAAKKIQAAADQRVKDLAALEALKKKLGV